MKAKLLVLIALVSLSACSLIWTPKGTVKSYMTAAQKGDVDKMTGLFSQQAIKEMGVEKIRENNQFFADTMQRAATGGSSYRMENVEQTSTPAGERVAFIYKNETDSIRLVFDLRKEGGSWKIDAIGWPELEAALPTEPVVEVPAISSPPPVEQPVADAKRPLKGTTISGGVLNGKATRLPKPPYPPIAKAAKASGTVVVQVVIDENGNVISASPVSGHPLLQAAAVAAARSAKFSPTKLSGEVVKVSGVITYTFTPE